MRKYLVAGFALLVAGIAFSADLKSKIGLEDLALGTGTFQRRTSSGGTVTMTEINAANLGVGYLSWDNISSRPTINGVTVTGAVLDNASNYPTLDQNTTGTAANVTGIVAVANGGTGSDNATGARANLGLNAVDNTSDADKPVSTATQSALDAKQDTTATLSDLSDGSAASPFVFNDDVYAKFGTDNDFRLYYKAADSTLVIALDNGDAMWTFNKTGGLVGGGEITVAQVNSTCSYADNNCFVNVGVASPPACTAALEMNSVFDNTTGAWVTCRGGSWVSATATSVAWDNVSNKPALAQVKDFVLKGYTTDDNTLLLWKADQAQTLTALACMTGGTDNVNVTLYECASDGGTCSTTGLTVTATSAGAADTSASNGSIDADDWVRVYLDTLQGTATYVSCRVKYTVTLP